MSLCLEVVVSSDSSRGVATTTSPHSRAAPTLRLLLGPISCPAPAPQSARASSSTSVPGRAPVSAASWRVVVGTSDPQRPVHRRHGRREARRARAPSSRRARRRTPASSGRPRLFLRARPLRNPRRSAPGPRRFLRQAQGPPGAWTQRAPLVTADQARTSPSQRLEPELATLHSGEEATRSLFGPFEQARTGVRKDAVMSVFGLIEGESLAAALN